MLKNNNIKKLLLIFVCLPLFISSQTTDYIKISGLVVDEATNEKLPFVNIFTNTNLGTISNVDGKVVFKYPKELINDTIKISSIGYKTAYYLLPNQNKEEIMWGLIPDTISLSEVSVLPLKGLDIVKNAISKIPENYDIKSVIMDAFYSSVNQINFSMECKNGEFLIKDLPYRTKNEVSVLLEKQPIVSNKIKDRIKLNAWRGESEANITDTVNITFFDLVVKNDTTISKEEAEQFKAALDSIESKKSLSSSGIEEVLEHNFIDKIKFHFLFSKKGLKKYSFEFKDIVRYNNRNTYVLDFRPKKINPSNPYVGTILIDIETSAFVALKYHMSKECDKCFEYKSMLFGGGQNINEEAQINFKRFNDKWNLSYISVKDEYKAKVNMGIVLLVMLKKIPKEKRAAFPRYNHFHFNYNKSLVVSNKYYNSNITFSDEELLLPKSEIVEYVNEDNEDIWGKYNYLEAPILPSQIKQE